MNTTSLTGARAYAVRIEYLSDSEPFALEQFILSIDDDADVHAVARDLADQSTYSNGRVPDLTCAITIVRQLPDDPHTPPSGSPAIIPRCPKCGADDISRDATARCRYPDLVPLWHFRLPESSLMSRAFRLLP